MAHLTTRQLKQLLEIDHAGPGIRAELQELITRLTSGGVGAKTDDLRVIQAKRLWDKGFGRELGIDTFAEYLATIPEIPQTLLAHDDRFPELILVDARLSFQITCYLLDVDGGGDAEVIYRDCDPDRARTEKVYWVRLQDGKQNRDKESVLSARDKFAKDEIGLTIHEGLAFLAQSPESLHDFVLNLASSVCQKDSESVACLNGCNEHPLLRRNHLWLKCPNNGVGSRRL